MAAPAVSVVVVSDYEAPGRKTWEHERAALDALVRQDFGEPFETLLVASKSGEASLPEDLRVRPGLRILFDPAERSSLLKDAGVRHCEGELVAVMEADCVPSPGWLRHLVRALRAAPGAAAVSARTTYAGASLVERCLSLLDRGFLDPGGAGPTPYVSNNGALYRREVLLRFPYPPGPNPYLTAIERTLAMRGAGLVFLFEPRAHMRHAFSGWRMEADIRRNAGFSTGVMVRRRGRGARAVWHLLRRRLREDWATCRRVHRDYGVETWQLPVALGLALVVRGLELPGILVALRGRESLRGSAYR